MLEGERNRRWGRCGRGAELARGLDVSEPTTVFNVGHYLDEIVRTPGGLRCASRLAIYDSEPIPNSIIYPI